MHSFHTSAMDWWPQPAAFSMTIFSSFSAMPSQGASEAGNDESAKQWEFLAPTLTDITFSASNVMSRQGVKERTTRTVHTVRQGVIDADNAVSTKQWDPQPTGAKTIFSSFSAMPSQGAYERATKAVHMARLGASEAGNDESVKQWSWK